ncbi:MAG: S-layer homology domain-containing protein [Bacillota bacterium]
MKKKKNIFMTIFEMIVLVLVVGYFANIMIGSTYATQNQNRPDVIVTIKPDNSKGHITTEGNLFGNDLWYPDKKDSGVIRIDNQFKSIEVSNLGLKVEIRKNGQPIDESDDVYTSFIRNMRITIEKGKVLSFSNNILVDSLPIGELLNGYKLNDNSQFTVDRNDTVDLKYTLHMDENAGNELQGITADIFFQINVEEDTTNIPSDDDDNDDNDNDNDNNVNLLVEEPQEVIPDLPGHWAHDCIIALLEHGIIEGYPDGTIKPDNYITRAEAAALVAKALQLEEKSQSIVSYTDDIPAWARGYIYATSDRDIFRGYLDGTFRPGKYITREEMTTVLIKAFNRKLQEDMKLNFPDNDDIGLWAEEYVKASVQHEVISGYPDGTFKPKNNITRAEAFTIICKLLGYHAEHNVTN